MRPRQRPAAALPDIWLFTDERVATGDLLAAARRLPRGAGIIFRHYRTAEAERRALFAALRRIARRRSLCLLLAGSDAEAARWGADGAHGRVHDRIARARFLRSAPVHDSAELRAAERQGVDYVFLSPLFATRSHPGARPLGPFRFAALAARARLPVMALGGVGSGDGGRVKRLGAAGYGAIDGLTAPARQNLPRNQNLNVVPT